jgi:hypothetical protein
MKKIYYLLVAAAMIISACQPKPKPVTVDITAEKAAVTTLFDKYHAAIKGMDVNAMATMIADDGLICGTDPSEFWAKKPLIDEWTKVASDTSIKKFDYTIDKREIRIESDGNSAVIIEQLILPIITSKIPVRLIYHAVKVEDKWLFDFISYNFILKNEDIARVTKALE